MGIWNSLLGKIGFSGTRGITKAEQRLAVQVKNVQTVARDRTRKESDARRRAAIDDQIERTRLQIKQDRERQLGGFARELRQTTAKEVDDIFAGFDEIDKEFAAPTPESEDTDWIPVTSTNVAAIRWVGGGYGLLVRFLPDPDGTSWEYGYAQPYTQFVAMLKAPSKGRFVWEMRWAKVPYIRIQGSATKPGGGRLLYKFGTDLDNSAKSVGSLRPGDVKSRPYSQGEPH